MNTYEIGERVILSREPWIEIDWSGEGHYTCLSHFSYASGNFYRWQWSGDDEDCYFTSPGDAALEDADAG